MMLMSWRDVRSKVLERYGLIIERDHWIWILGLYRDVGDRNGMRRAIEHINDLDRKIKEL